MTRRSFTYHFYHLDIGRWSVSGKAEINYDRNEGTWEIGHILSATAEDGTPMPKTDVAAALMREEKEHIQDAVNDEIDQIDDDADEGDAKYHFRRG